MTIGARLKEERTRLGMSQTEFAALASVKKGTQISWEKDTSSPTAAALAAFVARGVDAMYVLTGRRLPDITDGHDEWISSDLNEIERDLIAPSNSRLPDETPEQTENRLILKARSRLESIIEHDGANLPAPLLERATALLEAAINPHRLSLLRAADFAQLRQRRQHEKDMLYIWLEHGEYHPDNTVVELMARIALEYSVPHEKLVELAHAIHNDIESLHWADSVIRHEENSGQQNSTKG